MGSLLTRLRFVDVSPTLVEDMSRIVIGAHSPVADQLTIPALVEDLRTENPNVRLAIQRTLVAVAAADFPAKPVNVDLAKWTPAKEESPAQLDDRVRAWKLWWDAASTPTAP